MSWENMETGIAEPREEATAGIECPETYKEREDNASDGTAHLAKTPVHSDEEEQSMVAEASKSSKSKRERKNVRAKKKRDRVTELFDDIAGLLRVPIATDRVRVLELIIGAIVEIKRRHANQRKMVEYSGEGSSNDQFFQPRM